MNDLKTDFRNWLIKQGYSQITPSGKPSTIYDYIKKIDRVCKNERYEDWDTLASDLYFVILDYKNEMKDKYVTALIRLNVFVHETECHIKTSIRDRNPKELVLSCMAITPATSTTPKRVSETRENKDYLTQDELKDVLGFDLSTLKRWRKKNIGPAWEKHEKNVRYPITAVNEYLDSIFRAQ